MNKRAFLYVGMIKALLVVGFFAFIFGCVHIYQSQKMAIIKDVEEDLTAIAMLKAKQLSDWRKERIADVNVFSDRLELLENIRSILTDSAVEPGEKTVKQFKNIVHNYNYQNLKIFYPDGTQRWSLNKEICSCKTAIREQLELSFASGKPQFTKLHFEENEVTTANPHIGVIGPIFSEDGKPLGAVTLVSDASKFLFPLIEQWPVPGKTAETLLFRVEDNQILFLNNLRHKPDTALKLKINLDQTEIIAVKAAKGRLGFMSGKDYRGVSVIAVALTIEGSPWYMVAKVDYDEAFAHWQFISKLLLGLMALATILAFFLGLFLQQREKEMSKRLIYKAKIAQHLAEQRNSVTLKSIGDAVIVTDEHSRVELMNGVAENLTGWREEDAIGRPIDEVFKIFNAQNERPAELPVKKVLETGKIVGLANHTKIVSKNGEEHQIEDSGAPIKEENGQISGVVIVFRDVSETYRITEKLRLNEQRLRQLLKNSPVIIFSLHPDDFRATWISPNIEKILGYSVAECLAPNWWENHLFPDDRVQALTTSKKLFDAGEISQEYRMLHRNGEIIWVEDHQKLVTDESGRPLEIIGAMHDISDKRNLEIQLLQAQKMEAVGRLAGGIAHDFNNMLQFILGTAELAMETLDPDSAEYHDFQEIHRVGKRSADLTRQLLGFARKQAVMPKLLDLNDAVGGMLKMLQRLIGEDICLQWLPSEKPIKVRIDPSQLDQILANLSVNARDAISGTGTITIETKVVEVDDSYCESNPEAVPGNFAQLSFSDNGMGMDPETISKLFEPFFTTKKLGQGTGLGLATIYGIIKQNLGFINVYSEKGHGATFKVYLPLIAIAGEAATKEKPDSNESPVGGGESILLVEDEIDILKHEKKILEKLGYRVFATSSPLMALKMAEEQQNIDLLLTDVIMPEMNGRELSEQILANFPQTRVLFMSGYTAEVISHHGVLKPGMNFIQKPFSTRSLAQKISQVLGKD